MGGMPGQSPQMPPQGGGSPLGQLGQKKSSPDSGAPLLQMIMTLLAGAGLKDFTGSLTSLMKAGQPGGAHHKASGAPPGQQPSKGAPPQMPPGGPQPPPNVSGPPGAPPGPAGPAGGSIPPEILQKLMAMLMGGQGAQQPPPQG